MNADVLVVIRRPAMNRAAPYALAPRRTRDGGWRATDRGFMTSGPMIGLSFMAWVVLGHLVPDLFRPNVPADIVRFAAVAGGIAIYTTARSLWIYARCTRVAHRPGAALWMERVTLVGARRQEVQPGEARASIHRIEVRQRDHFGLARNLFDGWCVVLGCHGARMVVAVDDRSASMAKRRAMPVLEQAGCAAPIHPGAPLRTSSFHLL